MDIAVSWDDTYRASKTLHEEERKGTHDTDGADEVPAFALGVTTEPVSPVHLIPGIFQNIMFSGVFMSFETLKGKI